MNAVERLSAEQVEEIVGHRVDGGLSAWGYRVEGHIRAIGGLAWAAGRCWLWFTVIDAYRPPAVALWRMARFAERMAAAVGEKAVWVVRDAQFETSCRLLSRLGFTKTDETYDDREVWHCPVLN